MKVTSQEKNKLLYVDVHTVTSTMKEMYRLLLSQRIILKLIREGDMEAEILSDEHGWSGVECDPKEVRWREHHV